MRLLADLDRFQLSGVDLGEELERLSFLGPSHSDLLDYPDKGLEIGFSDGRMDAFTIALRHGAHLGSSDSSRVHPFIGQIRMAGRDLRPGDLGKEWDFSVWGEPYWRDEDDQEVLLFFEFPDGEIQVELGEEGRPLVLYVCAEPLMADSEQRESYGVTRDWPPSGIGG